MAKNNITKNAAPSKEVTLKKANEFKKLALSYKKKSPQQVFLNNIKDVLFELTKHKISYNQIAKAILETYSYKISPSIISSFIAKEQTKNFEQDDNEAQDESESSKKSKNSDSPKKSK